MKISQPARKCKKLPAPHSGPEKGPELPIVRELENFLKILREDFATKPARKDFLNKRRNFYTPSLGNT